MIYIGIPVHDERHTIGPLLWRIRELLLGQGRDFHLMVLDDGSSDGTAGSLDPYRRILPISLMRNEDRRGYAASLERIIRETVRRSRYPKRDALVTLQADFTDPPECIPEMVKRFEGGADLVLSGADEPRSPTGRIRFARVAAPLVARSLPIPPDVADPYGTFRLYRLFTIGRAVSELPAEESRLLAHQGWAANAELLLRVLPHVRRIEQIGGSVDHARRYRASRFRPLVELRDLRKAARDPAVRVLHPRSADEAAAR